MTTISNLQQISIFLDDLNSDELQAVANCALRLKFKIEEKKQNELMKKMERKEVIK